ncbi:hypothetical protein DPMN_135516 [Dreissena polymorpha]|uniref:Uncharacterized protein n=1 Tax=Dreissena polymorpha TaxID=45954 RepID=A0A9D4JFV6_DREPO|nr:hypothetical protein DPMN_135516 [Dreissena polymorpha]
MLYMIHNSGIDSGIVPEDIWQKVVCRLANNHKWDSLAMLICGRHRYNIIENSIFHLINITTILEYF